MLVRSLLPMVAAAAVVVGVSACDEGDGKTMRPPTSAQIAAMPTVPPSTNAGDTTTPLLGDLEGGLDEVSASPAAFGATLPWADGGAIDVRFTCDGDDVSPPISWTAPPEGTVELAVVMVDDSAGGFVHWAVAGLPPASGFIAEGAVSGGIDATNGFGAAGYGGPCPPDGESHSYRVTVYALGQQAELPADFTGADLIPVAEASAVGLTELTGTYQRPG